MQTIYDAKILIVDDNQDLLNLVTTALRSTACLLPRARPDCVHQPREGNCSRCNQKIKYHLQQTSHTLPCTP